MTSLLGEALVRDRVITDDQLKRAVRIQKYLEQPKQLGAVLIELGYATKQNIADAVPDTGWLTLVHTVALANAIANVAGYGLGKKDVSLLGMPSSKFLNIKDTRLAALRVDLEDKLAPLLQIIGQA